MEKFTESRIKL